MKLSFLRSQANSLTFAWTINSLAYSIVYPFLPLYLHSERGYPMTTVGLIFPLMGAAVIIVPLIAGAQADRIGRQQMMQLGQSGRAVLFVILALLALFHAPFWLFAVVLMANAGVGTFFQIGSDAYLTDITSPEERPRIFSRIRIGTNVGWALGPMLGFLLIGTPFWMLFMLTCMLCLAGAWYTGYACKPVTIVFGVKATASAAPKKLFARQLLSDRWLVGTLGCSFILFLLTSQLYSIMSVYATGVVGVSPRTLGLLYSLNGFTIIVSQMPVTWLLERLRLIYPKRLVIGALFYTIGYFSLGFAQNGKMMAISVIIITLGESAVMPSIYSAVSRLAPAAGVGRYMAALALVRGVGYAAGPFLGAILFDVCSDRPLMLWGLLSLLGVSAASGYALLARKLSMIQRSGRGKSVAL